MQTPDEAGRTPSRQVELREIEGDDALAAPLEQPRHLRRLHRPADAGPPDLHHVEGEAGGLFMGNEEDLLHRGMALERFDRGR